ncbi:permease prefix domain 1-containing protein [Desulfosporosinus sp. SYSU MS00001]|uniref:permease prefix domain 1-containing protein n=1 Tax=Desulfosporosinus sp. SYSU MS00001 TaxID=3416284 RepID=UPI003CE7221C
MTKIDSYLDSVFRDSDKSQESNDLKLEMRNHLESSIKELQESGLTEEESAKVAIDRFGEEFQIRNELSQVLRFQNKFNKNILKVSLVFLVVCIILLITFFYKESVFKERYNAMNEQIISVEKAFMNKGIAGADKVLKGVFKDDSNNYLTYVAIKELPQDFGMEKDDPNNLLVKSRDLFAGDLKYSYPENVDNKFLNNRFGTVVTYNNTKYMFETGVKTTANWNNSSIYLGISILFFVVSWILWIIWSIANVFRQGKLNTGWAILLILTSIFGYFIFLITSKSERNRLAQA